MNTLILACIALALLLWGADRFVEGPASTARHLGMSPLLIGMVVVGFGTSAPEMVVSAMAAMQGNPGIALGNAYGSNLFNTLAVVGIAFVIHPMRISTEVLTRDVPVMAVLTLSLLFIGYGFKGHPGRIAVWKGQY